MTVNKYVFTGDGFDSIQCLHARAEIVAEFSGRTFGMDFGTSTLHRAEGEYAIKEGLTAQECCEIGVEITRLGMAAEAMRYYRKAVALEPTLLLPHSFLIIGHDYAGSSPKERIAELKAAAGKLVSRSTRIGPHFNSPNPNRRIRVGYVSGDFYRHSAFNTWYPLMREHDREKFEVFAYHTGPIKDDYTHSIRMNVEHYRDVSALEDNALDQLIRTEEIDILIDLSCHTAGHRLQVFARKPAPIQMPGFGFVEGNGLTTTDYVFGDRLLLSQDERKLIGREVFELPSAFFYEPPADMPGISECPSAWGEPFTFGCFNKVDKITDAMLAAWAQIINKVPNSRLLMKDPWYDQPIIRAQMGVRLQRAGFNAKDVILYGESVHMEHMRLMDELDVALDPSPHSGGTSTAEMLWQGVPVVSLFGPNPSGRLTSALLMRAGLGMFVARDVREYIDIAVACASERNTLVQLRATMRQRLLASPLCDIARNVRAVEEIYKEVFRRWCDTHKRKGTK